MHAKSVGMKVPTCMDRVGRIGVGYESFGRHFPGDSIETEITSRNQDRLLHSGCSEFEDLTTAAQNSSPCGRSPPTTEGIRKNNINIYSLKCNLYLKCNL